MTAMKQEVGVAHLRGNSFPVEILSFAFLGIIHNMAKKYILMSGWFKVCFHILHAPSIDIT